MAKFNDNSFLSCFDLSTSRQMNSDVVIPTVKRGAIRYTVEFSAPLKTELIMLVFTEHPSAMAIDAKRKILFSFYTSLN